MPTTGGQKTTDGKGKEEVYLQPTEATIVATLPADAKLLIDDQPTVSTSGTRVFITPALDNGRDFHYTLKAEVVREGKTQSVVKEVTVRAGQETRVNIELPVAVASK
jgi:uncharacterized protein (TIGR03000 family)